MSAQPLPDYQSLLNSVPGAAAAPQLQRLDEGLRRALNSDIEFGNPAPASAGYRAAPLASLLQEHGAAPTALTTHSSIEAMLSSAATDWLGTSPRCAMQSLAMPDSIAAAMDQVEQLADSVASTFSELLSGRNRNRLTRYHGDVISLLNRNPFGGELARSESRDLRRYLGALNSADLEALLCAAQSWSRLADPQWLNQLQRLMAAHDRFAHNIIAERTTGLGHIVLGGSGSSALLRQDLVFLADLGGDDIYGIESSAAFSSAPQFIVDFSGNDRYESSRSNGMASGVGRVSILVDLEGNDHYRGTTLVQGSAILGVGILQDLTGNDSYEADSMAQGFGLYGIGMLVDEAGNDRFRIQALGQGLGMAAGLGTLTDHQGDDEYIAGGAIPTDYGTPGLSDAWAQGVGLGIRNLARGGTGRLIDGGGRDRFDGGSFAQGGGYYLGIGEFLNLGNDPDTYLGSRYNFGWGAHGGIGSFVEAGGDDRYRTRQIVAAGLAWDRSLALFLDYGGDDIYAMGDFSLGASALGSAAVFFDQQGSDRYGGVTPARAEQEPPNLSVFFELGPEPNYLDNEPMEKSCRYEGSLSITLSTASAQDASFDHCTSPAD